eukprot:388985-Pelagomonas_calceolata.AAC.4
MAASRQQFERLHVLESFQVLKWYNLVCSSILRCALGPDKRLSVAQYQPHSARDTSKGLLAKGPNAAAHKPHVSGHFGALRGGWKAVYRCSASMMLLARGSTATASMMLLARASTATCSPLQGSFHTHVLLPLRGVREVVGKGLHCHHIKPRWEEVLVVALPG